MFGNKFNKILQEFQLSMKTTNEQIKNPKTENKKHTNYNKMKCTCQYNCQTW